MNSQVECAKESVTPVCVSLKAKGMAGRLGLRKKSKRKEKKEGQCVWDYSIVLQQKWDRQKRANIIQMCVKRR